MRPMPLILVLVFVLGAFGIAYAQGTVTGEILTFTVTKNHEGEEKILPAVETETGQVMEFHIVFTNNGDSGVNEIQVVEPIPQNTRFIRDSHSTDVNAQFGVSIDGGETFEPEPIIQFETQDDGSRKEIIVSTKDYTHVRWVASEELASQGGQHMYRYRVTVE